MFKFIISAFLSFFLLSSCVTDPHPLIKLKKGDRIALIGNNLCSRMMNFGFFEQEIQLRFPDSLLFVRNLCDGGNRPGFRPHSGRNHAWAFPDAEKFYDELSADSSSEGHFESEDEWLDRLNANIIFAFFGYNESFDNESSLENNIQELEAFIDHTLAQMYHPDRTTQLVLISPTALENYLGEFKVPDLSAKNANLKKYTHAMQQLAEKKSLAFIDLYSPSQRWFSSDLNYTIDGLQLNEEGYKLMSDYLVTNICGSGKKNKKVDEVALLSAVKDKNWHWHHDFKSPNGVHVFGRRYDPFGPDNYPYEIKKNRELTLNRDTAIWKIAIGEQFDLNKADEHTTALPEVKTNYILDDYGRGEAKYKDEEQSINSLTVAEGYKIELFASEKQFKELANPVQLSFDDKGRLWVAVMPTYPHYKPGDERPNDKLIILEDTDGDGRADKLKVWADHLHIPVGFEFAPEGVYISQGTNLKLLTDTDGDDKADKEEIILSGFDDHDTHHVISAFCADPSGALVMGEGVFLHSNVETVHGPVHATNGGFYRYSPQKKHLERVAQVPIPNPWGTAFDRWGQDFFAVTSGPDVHWMMPSQIKPRYGVGNKLTNNLIEEDHKVRPTSGLEFVSSRHFPVEVQGDMLINNTIGFLGTKQHKMEEEGTGFMTSHRMDLLVGTDKNFRPVDMEFAPDGSLYIVDWHNVLIGHMQHNARDPLRDHVHGRIYRITYPSRALVQPAQIDGASISVLLDNLKLPEYRTRYRTRRALRGRDKQEVLNVLDDWIANMDTEDRDYSHHLLEGLWVQWGLNSVEESLLEKVLAQEDHRARAAAIRVLRYSTDRVTDYENLLKRAAMDEHGRVRLEAMVAASWMEKELGLEILALAKNKGLDEWSKTAYETAYAHLNGYSVVEAVSKKAVANLSGAALKLYEQGEVIYNKEGYCSSCHQPNGKGLIASEYPSLSKTEWVEGSEERLIKLTLKGLYGPIKVNGKSYVGAVPMTPFEGLLDDDEVAAVLTYVRNSFGNSASMVDPELVKKIRAEIIEQEGFYKPNELLKMHPMD